MGIQVVGVRARAFLALLMIGIAASAAGCGSSSSGSETGGGTAADSTVESSDATLSDCGNETKAPSGSPIVLGAIITNLPGADSTEVTNSTKAYFDCVNEHGGISGHPIKYIVETEQLNPQEDSAVASKLINEDNVMGMVGNTSLIDCSVNGKTYEAVGLKIIGAGADAACYELPSFASVTLGPTYSDQLAAEYLIEEEGVDSVVAATTQAPGAEALNTGILDVAKAAGVSVSSVAVPVPITDPNGTALSLAEKAGENGGVVLDLAPEELVKVLTAAEKQGLTDRTHWGCGTTCSSLVNGLGSAWNGKLFVGTEFPGVESSSPDMNLYRAVTEKYNSSEDLSTFGQMGFLSGKIYADTLQELPASQLNRAGINKAIGEIEDYETDMLCEPWSFGSGKSHIPVTAGRIFAPENGKLKEVKGCTPLQVVTPGQKAAEAAG